MKNLIAGLALVGGAVALGRKGRGLNGLGLMSDSTMTYIHQYQEGLITATEMYLNILEYRPGDLNEAIIFVHDMEMAAAGDRYARAMSRGKY
jgi:hypothetical protein